MFITLVGIVYIPDFPTGHCSKVSMFLSNNTPSSDEYDELSESTINSSKLSQFIKELSPILVVFFGIDTLVKSAQPANARLPIFIVLSGIMILAKFWQLANALSPISITFFEIFICVQYMAYSVLPFRFSNS